MDTQGPNSNLDSQKHTKKFDHYQSPKMVELIQTHSFKTYCSSSSEEARRSSSSTIALCDSRLVSGPEVAAGGQVLIPERWGKEELLKDWIDYSSFDALLAPNGIVSARAALASCGGTKTQLARSTQD